MDSITIGVLLPASTIFPIGKEFEKGLKDALAELKSQDVDVEIVKEFIGQGDIKGVEKACDKLFNYDDVDIVVSFLSNKVAGAIAERFSSKRIPLLASNVGGHIPEVGNLNEYVFTNSLQLWRHAWTLGNYGVKNFGPRGMFVASVYDAGYGFSQLFHMGMKAADENSYWCFSVPPMPPAGALSNMDIIFPYMEEHKPDFVFAAFCGGETTLFLNKFIEYGWHKKVKLLGLPYLLSPFAPVNDDITIYTTAMSDNATAPDPAKAFYYLGREAGKTVARAVVNAANKQALKDEIEKLDTMFTVAKADNDVPGIDPQISIIENKIRANEATFSSAPVEPWRTFSLNTAEMKPLTDGIHASWYNPYLCI